MPDVAKRFLNQLLVQVDERSRDDRAGYQTSAMYVTISVASELAPKRNAVLKLFTDFVLGDSAQTGKPVAYVRNQSRLNLFWPKIPWIIDRGAIVFGKYPRTTRSAHSHLGL
jgi:hypothetical protein